MTTARKDFMQADKIGTFHLVVRCVRRSFLQGFDEYSGKDYSHRKSWITDKIKQLLEAFAIDIAGVTVMDNHFHLVSRNRPDLLKNLTPFQLVVRWLKIHPTKEMRNEKRSTPTQEELNQILLKYGAEELRRRLSDISWFMRELNQYIAVKANREDKCKGSFFESRFKSQNLADDAAILTCMIYCDLNPIRAQIADSIETSFHTSGYVRYQAEMAKNNLLNAKELIESQPKTKLNKLQKKEIKKQKEIAKINNWLAPIEKLDLNLKDKKRTPILNITLNKYLELLDYTGREYHKDKPGIISGNIAPILDVMGLSQKQWFENLKNYGKWYYRVLGPLIDLKDKLISTKQRWFKGIKAWANRGNEEASSA
jgi:REP element-mobilizing transposase RayT